MYLSRLRKAEIWNFGLALRILWNEFRNYPFIEKAEYKKRDQDIKLDEMWAEMKELKELIKNNITISSQKGSSP